MRAVLTTWRRGEISSVAPHGPRDFAFGVALGDRLSLVVLLLATRESYLHLRVVARKVHAQRNERISLLAHLADQARDLLAVQQQLARPHRLVVHDVGLLVRRDMHVLQPRRVAAAVDSYEPIAEVRGSVAHRFDLGPGELDPSLELLVYEVVVVSAPIDRNVALALILPLRHRP